MMSETKLDRTVSTAEFLHNNFTAVEPYLSWRRSAHRCAQGTGRGRDLAGRNRQGLWSDVCTSKLARGNPPLYVGAYYRPPSDNATNTSLDGLRLALDQVLK